jgi:inhibitor of KinA
MADEFRTVQAGDSVLIVEFEERIDARVNARALRVAAAVAAAGVNGIRDVVPTYRTVAVYFDPLRTDYETLRKLLEREAGAAEGPAEGPTKAGPHRDDAQRKDVGSQGTDVGSGFSRIDAPPVRIPVCYGGAFGPDLIEVAAHASLTEADVIARHSAPIYRVFMMGFVPGFAYLGTVDAAIAVPRRRSPRLRVAAGSVGIAGSQTGIYPTDSPGGWQLVGRTPVRMFDLNRPDPFLLKPGDAVQFYSIPAGDYDRADRH